VTRLFLDANLLFSAAYREDAGVGRLWEVTGVELVTSEYAVEEARRNLSDPAQHRRLEELLRGMRRVAAGTLAPDQRAGILLREKDWPILAGALQAGATHLITGDCRDFGPYFGTEILGILVQTPADYLRTAAEEATTGEWFGVSGQPVRHE
jgi:predicted nucleic acid-binding protein